MRLAMIPPSAILRAWPDLGGMIARACERPGCDHTETTLRAACLAGEAALIAILDNDGRPVAAGVTQVREQANGARSCWILALGGHRSNAWLHTLEHVEAGARHVGCETVEFVGRRAWERLLPSYFAEACATGTHYSKRL
ncbi:hypothetical protein IPV08_16025 [Methylobacterium sp. SD274]|uniref:hypothetical protein n=1 Tax=Methylobacterium sp. SD274 TaxID=2782009 RepID=UPI001A97A2C0|nr:hypothetical protein [Methylobacterium sp. SD274]MBO1021469.1 hypothetical protein [Methylobacterium sp. SD274]